MKILGFSFESSVGAVCCYNFQLYLLYFDKFGDWALIGVNTTLTLAICLDDISKNGIHSSVQTVSSACRRMTSLKPHAIVG